MTKQVLETIDVTLGKLAPLGIPASDSARAMLYAIAGQESNWTLKFQLALDGGRGPARGLWQFEMGGGVTGVLNHAASAVTARKFTAQYVGTHNTNTGAVWATLAYEDILACVFARLLLWTLPNALPPATIAGKDEAWRQYIAAWRPGRPRPEKWEANWAAALAIIKK